MKKCVYAPVFFRLDCFCNASFRRFCSKMPPLKNLSRAGVPRGADCGADDISKDRRIGPENLPVLQGCGRGAESGRSRECQSLPVGTYRELVPFCVCLVMHLSNDVQPSHSPTAKSPHHPGPHAFLRPVSPTASGRINDDVKL